MKDQEARLDEPLLPNGGSTDRTVGIGRYGRRSSSGDVDPEDPLSTQSNSSFDENEASIGDRSRMGNTIHTAHTAETARMLDRNGVFHQSRGHWGVQIFRKGIRLRPCTARHHKNMWEDWFYNLSYKNTMSLTLILVATYAAIIVAFAYIYLGVSVLGAKYESHEDGTKTHHTYCGMDISNHMEALYFSLSTMTTVGYGVSDYYFGDCWSPWALVLCQSICAIFFQAVAIGLLLNRVARGQKRGRTVIFSDKAVVRHVNGVPYFMFRIGELRRHQLIDASAHAYCIRHERYPTGKSTSQQQQQQQEQEQEQQGDKSVKSNQAEEGVEDVETFHFITREMKLLQESHILMSLPQVIVHRLDEKSPLLPPKLWYDEHGVPHRLKDDPTERSDSDEMYDFLRDGAAEIVVMVEGTDELTGHSLQARHSYSVEDVAFDHTFGSCVEPWTTDCDTSRRSCLPRRHGDPVVRIDFSKFHDLKPVDSNGTYDPYVPL